MFLLSIITHTIIHVLKLIVIDTYLLLSVNSDIGDPIITDYKTYLSK